MQLWQNFISLPSSLSRLFTRSNDLLNTVSCIVPNTFDFNNDQPTDFLLYGKEDLDKINNTSIVDAIINYLIETKRLNAQLFFGNVSNFCESW